jgi:hypothetical protein
MRPARMLASPAGSGTACRSGGGSETLRRLRCLQLSIQVVTGIRQRHADVALAYRCLPQKRVSFDNGSASCCVVEEQRLVPTRAWFHMTGCTDWLLPPLCSLLARQTRHRHARTRQGTAFAGVTSPPLRRGDCAWHRPSAPRESGWHQGETSPCGQNPRR